MSSPTVQGINVRSIISIFENQSSDNYNKGEKITALKRTKSLGSLSTKKVIQKSTERILVKDPKSHIVELNQIEKELGLLEERIAHYRIYEKDTHIYFQNELLTLLTDIVNIEASVEENLTIARKKKQLIDSIKLLNRSLNSLLPSPSDLSKISPHQKTSTLSIQLGGKPADVSTADQTESRNLSIKSDESSKSVDQIGKSEETSTKSVLNTRDVLVDTGIPSVQKLRNLFEKKSSQSDGLQALSQETSPRKYLSFNGDSCDIKYIPYKDLEQQALATSTEKTYLVDAGETFPEDRVVHNVGIFRSSSRTCELKNLFENITIKRATKPVDKDSGEICRSKLCIEKQELEAELAKNGEMNSLNDSTTEEFFEIGEENVVNGLNHQEDDLLEGEGITKV